MQQPAFKDTANMIAVSGDELRNNAYVFAHNGFLGHPVGKKIHQRKPHHPGATRHPAS